MHGRTGSFSHRQQNFGRRESCYRRPWAMRFLAWTAESYLATVTRKVCSGLCARRQGSTGSLEAVVNLPDVTIAPKIEELYSIKCQLGVGMTALVMEGVSRQDGQRYALKAFNVEVLAANEEACDALHGPFSREAPSGPVHEPLRGTTALVRRRRPPRRHAWRSSDPAPIAPSCARPAYPRW